MIRENLNSCLFCDEDCSNCVEMSNYKLHPAITQAIEQARGEYSKVDAELKRAENKHPNFPQDMFRQLAIMQEEAGEVTKAVLHYHYEDGTIEHVKEELTQTAAMCMRMLKNLKPNQ
jgi:NTP pyrophosphatase (non-canonical NTP hydrolase)